MTLNYITAVAKDITYQTVWKTEYCEYTITWIMTSSDGQNIAITEVCKYNTMPLYRGNIYEPEEMTFVSWDKEINSVTKDYTYTAIYKKDVLEGDINGDGKVNSKDATRLFQYISGWDVELYAGDYKA